MQFSQQVFDYYLQYVTAAWFGRNDLPPEDLSGYKAYVEELKLHLAKHHDEQIFKAALESALTSAELDYERYSGGAYPFEPEEVQAIMHYIYQSLWPEAELPAVAPAIEWLDLNVNQWFARKKA
ncbi:hypothetical protein [Herpetosiphon geysericola]|uniref:Uncharacterized protein n=1 Tax=Herpetosiphon geysericola TaxID=70996 RepID=A0A0P6XRI6_9CHLR|nr:hypothetical protein [Herpetosiphon geysericola]KPL85171.1 hypothetical protein SE18_15855 [Herpetosiphon geysericola]